MRTASKVIGVEGAVGEAVAAEDGVDERDGGGFDEQVFLGVRRICSEQAGAAGFPLLHDRAAAEEQFVDEWRLISAEGDGVVR